jgi:phosphoribosyl 1,2-cyclic phosphate phosphodiesterase
VQNQPYPLKITFLGTGTSQGVPMIACNCHVCSSLDFRDKRLRTSVLINYNNTNLLIDSGPDFRQQMLRERVSQLDAVIFTHEHKDHIGGLDEVRAFNIKTGDKYMPIYARERVMNHIKTEFSYAFQEVKYKGVPLLEPHIIGHESFQVLGVPIIPLEVKHYKLDINAFRIGNFTYVTDASYISPEQMDKMRGSEIMVLNGLQIEPHMSHYNLAQALEVIAEIKPEKAYLTHISHKLGKHQEIGKLLPRNVNLAFDGLMVSCN